MASTKKRKEHTAWVDEGIFSTATEQQSSSTDKDDADVTTKRARPKRSDDATDNSVKGETQKPRICTVEGCAKWNQKGGLCCEHGSKPTICSHEGCTYQIRRGGLCRLHDGRSKTCTHEGCTNQVHRGNLCDRHRGHEVGDKVCSYPECTSKANHGDVCRIHRTCSHDGCSNIGKQRGMCRKHDALINPKKCSHEGCTNHAPWKGLCSEHGGAYFKRCNHEGCSKKSQRARGGPCVEHGEESGSKIANNPLCEPACKSFVRGKFKFKPLKRS